MRVLMSNVLQNNLNNTNQLQYNLVMNSFDPFMSSDYKKNYFDQIDMEPEPQLNKKSESEFISQLLNSSIKQPFLDNIKNIQSITNEEKETENAKIQENQISSESGSSKKSTSKNSPFHNFQKHLVITLRQILTMEGLNRRTGEQYELAHNIFQIFKTSSKTSRQFLQQIYGIYQSQNTEFLNTIENSLRKGELKSVLEDYDLKTIFKAQQILRQLTKLELDMCDLEDCLIHRKIQKKNQFIAYIDLFKKQLVSGKQRKKTYKELANKFASKKS